VTSSSLPARALRGLVLSLAVAGLPAVAATAPAQAASAGLVVAEVYGAGGNSGASYSADFVELRNLGSTAASLTGLSLAYRSAGGSVGGSVTLDGSVAPGARYLVRMSAPGSTGAALPTPDEVASPAVSMSSTSGTVELRSGSGVVDLVGYGATASVSETRPTGVDLSATLSAQRYEGEPDTDDNAADFAEAAPTPGAAGPTRPPAYTIAEIQGTGTTSPLAGQTVSTRGVVTARYPTGGYAGFYLQTPGTPDTPGASDAVFVYAPGLDASAVPFLGASVDVVGRVSEFNGSTQVTLAGAAAPLSPALPAVTPLAAPWTDLDSETEKEAHEGELIAPQGHFTVTDSYGTDQYGEIGLAAGTTPLLQPTDVADAQGSGDEAVAADNARRRITLDDGASVDFRNAANVDAPLSWLTPSTPVRAGAPVTFTGPVVLEFRNNLWKLQPVRRITGAGSATATFGDTRTATPAAVGGDLRLATFNVLNFFPTTGVQWAAAAAGRSCTYFRDRDGAPTTVDECVPDGPRGAADQTSLARQRGKIVSAINRLGASVVSLEEIENSAKFGQDRDAGVAALVDALNAAAGAGTWAYALSPSPSELPPLAQQDVIRTAFIYRPADVSLLGASRVLTGSAAFEGAREPLAQAFQRRGGSDTFTVVVNHFKSKRSGTPDPDGQGAGNAERVAQARALDAFARGFAAERGTAAVFLTGDFNAYTQEDPVQELTGSGWTNLESTTAPGRDWSYFFGGLAGSLDHVFANPAALAMVTGVDVWSINAEEPVSAEYSRYNSNTTQLFEPGTPFRASDHNPEVVGIRAPLATTPAPTTGQPTVPAPAPARSTTSVAVVGKRVRVDGRRAKVLVSVSSTTAVTGTVTVRVRGQRARTVTLSGGTATVRLGRFARPGAKRVTVTYSGSGTVLPSSQTVRLRVRR
jgi:predicted extracellular nuclease